MDLDERFYKDRCIIVQEALSRITKRIPVLLVEVVHVRDEVLDDSVHVGGQRVAYLGGLLVRSLILLMQASHVLTRPPMFMASQLPMQMPSPRQDLG